MAYRCRANLLHSGLGTKILPEAYTWHFAACWDHMPELVESHKLPLSQAFLESKTLLARAVSIPVTIKQDPKVPELVYDAIYRAIEKE